MNMKVKAISKLTYDEAKEELEAIVTSLNEDDVSIDSLTEKIKRASQLIEYCKKKLRSTEEEIKKHIIE